MLALYRSAISHRRRLLSGFPATLEWIPSPNEILAFRHGALTCIANLSAEPFPLPAHLEPLIASAEVINGNLPPQATAWLQPMDADAPETGKTVGRVPHTTKGPRG